MRRFRKWTRRGLIAAAVVGIWVVLLTVVTYSNVEVPKLDRPVSAIVLDRHGDLLDVERSSSDAFRIELEASEMSPWLRQATIAVEDQRFYSHAGFDPAALMRAVRDNLTHGRRVSGASTITMQLVRILRPRARTYRAKVVEILTAFKLERSLPKEEILTAYLNNAPYGSNVVGCEAAARTWFGRSAKQLGLAESALLAGLPQSPERLRPDRHPGRARTRRDVVLRRMYEEGFITREDMRRAMSREVRVTRRPWPNDAPHAVALARRHSRRTAGLDPGRLQTTLDPELQARAEAILRRHVDAAREQGVHNGAVIVMENTGGEIRALVGSPYLHDVEHGGQVNAALARRSPGSTLKPFLFALAFERGVLGYGEKLDNQPRRIDDYRPVNFDESSSAPVAAWAALARSLNVPAVEVLDRIGLDPFVELLGRLGMDYLGGQRARFGLSLALGACEVSLLDLVEAYAVIGRGGWYLPARILDVKPPAPQRVLGEGPAALVARALSRAATSPIEGNRAASFAAKTGTSWGRRDAWTIATSALWTVGVWLGNVDGTPSDFLIGRQAAAPVVTDVLSVLPGEGKGRVPTESDEIESSFVCVFSGLALGAHCNDLGSSPVLHAHPPRRCTLSHTEGPLTGRGPRILSPLPGDPYRAALPSTPTVPIEAWADAAANQTLHWFLDDILVASCSPGVHPILQVHPGTHDLRCIDDSGRSDQVRFQVE